MTPAIILWGIVVHLLFELILRPCFFFLFHFVCGVYVCTHAFACVWVHEDVCALALRGRETDVGNPAWSFSHLIH